MGGMTHRVAKEKIGKGIEELLALWPLLNKEII